MVNMDKILFIGDVHFQHSNMTETTRLLEKIVTLEYDWCVLAGDVLHTHETIHVQLLNRAYNFIQTLRDKTPVVVLVGNHDYLNNQQFLTDAHWMNGMKEWHNVTIIDTTTRIGNYIYVPYVYPGRFVEALSKIDGWITATCIFAHQEIRGCKMGAFVSEIGDEWDESWPLVISGHIHERQRSQMNVLYPGSAITHAFGASDSNQGVSIFTFASSSKQMEEERIDVGLDNKKTVYAKIGDPIKSKDLNASTRFCMSGSIADVEAFKKSRQYKMLKEANVKVVFKPDNRVKITSTVNKSALFETILSDLIAQERDQHLVDDYRTIKDDK